MEWVGAEFIDTPEGVVCDEKFEPVSPEPASMGMGIEFAHDTATMPASIPKPETTATQFEIDVLTHIQHEALQAQGDWAGIDEEYAPEWTHGYKLIYNELANLIDWLEAKS